LGGAMVLDEVRVGIAGLGTMGRRHLDTLVRVSGARAVAVATRSEEKRAEARASHGVYATADYRGLVDQVDAVVVSVPTVLHAEVAAFFLAQGKHVLVEKPIAASAEEARQLVEAAARAEAVLMVGHIERFNPAYLRFRELLLERGGLASLGGDVAVQAFRMGPFDGRIQDVGVELDLMIHDVDAVHGLVPGADLKLGNAQGMRVITSHLDIALAGFEAQSPGKWRLRATVLASRVADARRRIIRLEHPEWCAELDFLNQALSVGSGGRLQPVTVTRASPLDGELQHFVDCIRHGATPTVTGLDGWSALQLCEEVGRAIRGEPAMPIARQQRGQLSADATHEEGQD
jgi:UDP-N-acetylglucosamine 3-dehydrogenase